MVRLTVLPQVRDVEWNRCMVALWTPLKNLRYDGDRHVRRYLLLHLKASPDGALKYLMYPRVVSLRFLGASWRKYLFHAQNQRADPVKRGQLRHRLVARFLK